LFFVSSIKLPAPKIIYFGVQEMHFISNYFSHGKLLHKSENAHQRHSSIFSIFPLPIIDILSFPLKCAYLFL